VVKATAKIVGNQFHNANYAFAILTLTSAHSMLVSARQISVAKATTQLIVKIESEMSTIREQPKPNVDARGCRTVNCCGAFLKVFWLAISVNETFCGA
jgi:hypothetical protein